MRLFSLRRASLTSRACEARELGCCVSSHVPVYRGDERCIPVLRRHSNVSCLASGTGVATASLSTSYFSTIRRWIVLRSCWFYVGFCDRLLVPSKGHYDFVFAARTAPFMQITHFILVWHRCRTYRCDYTDNHEGTYLLIRYAIFFVTRNYDVTGL